MILGSPSVGEHQPITTTTPPGSSGPSPQLSVVIPGVPPSQPPCPETSTQPPIEPDISPVKLRHSTRVRRPPKWQTSDDSIL